MCEAVVYLGDKEIMRDVIKIVVDGEDVVLTNIEGKSKRVKNVRILEDDVLNHKVKLG
ncbi:MAG: RNA-binding protein [Candidatus Hydrothermarchaeota archaeon]|nr:MAG: RNA-binding protein [Candidatus Hydrothermarchaeota archaeon]RLG60258.1 MAG: RNA-binding protein [Candidatus Hydrothermarchaeota archaeon]